MKAMAKAFFKWVWSWLGYRCPVCLDQDRQNCEYCLEEQANRF